MSDLVKTVLSVQLAEAFHPWLELRGLLRVAGDNPKMEVQGQPLVIDRKDRKQRVILEIRAFALQQEDAQSAKEAVDSALSLMSELKEVVTIPKVAWLRYDAIFIESYTLPFHELVDFIKRSYLVINPLTEHATDVGITLDQQDNEWVRHIQLGPMKASQLQSDFLAWPRDNLPQQFVFLSLGCMQIKEMTFDIDHIRQFLEDTIDWQEKQAQEILRYLHERGV